MSQDGGAGLKDSAQEFEGTQFSSQHTVKLELLK